MATVLFVDDDPGILSALKRLFFDSAHTVLFACGPQEGLAVLKERECAVVVSDNRMPPGESGIQEAWSRHHGRERAGSPNLRLYISG
jgi:DNA-binding NtrC family response regulator